MTINRRQFTTTLLAGVPGVLWSARAAEAQAQAALRVNGARLNANLAALSMIGPGAEGGTSRVAYSDADREAREFAMRLMRDARLEVRIDAAGNILGRRAGRDPAQKPLVIGSHIDSVPAGGSYDGQVGSMAAIEVAQVLAERQVVLRHPLEVVVFQNEEGGTVGSKAIAKGLTDKDLEVVSNSGKTIRDGIRVVGGDPDARAGAVRNKGDVAAYVELHIEQGGILDTERTDIGVVEGIVGVYWWDITIQGVPNYAGTTPMDQRRDALLAAARYVEAVNRVGTTTPGRQVATVGKIQAFPGAHNVVPGQVTTSLDLRDLDAVKVQAMFERLQGEVRQIEAATGTTFTFTRVSASEPAPSDSRVRGAIDASAKALGLTTRLMPSGAGHDAQEMAMLGPMGMIFIPSRDGISHSPREFSTPESITNGANVLLQSVLRLDAMDLA